MKKISYLLFSAILGAILLFALVSCGECDHTYGEWITDREASESVAGERHRECTKCGEKETEAIPKLEHTHTYATEWSKDDTYHWHASTCGHVTEISGKAEHTYGNWIVDREATEESVGAKHRVCTTCGTEETAEIAKLPHTHKYATEWSKDDTYHWHASACGHETEVADKAEHTYGEWIIDHEATEDSVGAKHRVCTTCGTEETAEIAKLPHTHKYAAEWSKDDNYHWHASTCGHETEVADKAEHTYENGVCTVCGNRLPSVGLSYTKSSDGSAYTVSGIGTCKDTEIIIPSEYSGLPVTSIGYRAFYGCTGLTSITIPESVTSIYNSAFEGCTGLTSIKIPDSVTRIGDGAFYNTAYYNDDSNWENGVLYIGNHLIVAKTLISGDCTIKSGTKCIGDYAFSYCKGLTSIEIPNGVTSIGSSAFEGCTGLTGVYITDLAKWCAIDFKSYDANPLIYAHNLYLNGALVTELKIPEGVTSIGWDAFYGCTGLTSITIPDSVTSIGEYAFSGCTGLTSITIPNSVQNIWSAAFCKCTNLKTVTFAENSQCSSIGHSAFSSCTGLTSITIPNSVTSIGDYAFRGCTGLTSITIPDSVTSIGSSAFYNTAYYNDSSHWENGVLYIGNHLITVNSSISGGYTINSGTKCIGNSAFKGCTGLTSITIPNSVTSIGKYVFSSCTGLTGVTIPESVQNIGGEAFYKCTNLKTVTFAGNSQCSSIGRSAFYGCTGLTSITIPDGVTSIGYYAFEGCTRLTSVTIPESVQNIGLQAFYKCTNLKTVTFAGNSQCSSIGRSAFYGCTGLTSITIPDGVQNIGAYAFYECTNLKTVTFAENSQCSSIGDSAFRDCTGLTSITIPDNVTSIGGAAFAGCTGLTSITVESGNQRYHSVGNCLIETETKTLIFGYKNSVIPADGSVMSIGGAAFAGCTGLTSITIPNSVTSIGDSAFEGCTGLTSITIPDGVTSIGGGAFYHCTELTSITIPDSVTSIGEYAFSGCTGLTSVTIPNSVTSIGDYAFKGCSNLKDIYYTGTQSEWGTISKGYDWDYNTGDYTIHYANEE